MVRPLTVKPPRSKFSLYNNCLVLKAVKEVSKADRLHLFQVIRQTLGVRQTRSHSWLVTRSQGLHTKNSELYNQSIFAQIHCSQYL